MKERYAATPELDHHDEPERRRIAPGKRTLTERLVQRRVAGPVQRREPDDVHGAAQHGVSGPAGALPHADAIQRAFGKHDLGRVRAHTGTAAAEGAAAMGARAFASGDDVAFAPGAADLHTAAHEAAHVIQQRAGVQLSGGVGAAGDAYERHADAVADLVVQGRSAEALLDEYAGASTGAGTQRAVQRAVGFEFETGWFIDKQELVVPDIEDVPSKALPKTTGKTLPLKKKERIGNTSHTNFKVEADEADGGRSEIEFVLHPPVPEGKEGFELLKRTLNEMVDFGHALLKAAGQSKAKTFTLDQATGATLDQFYVVEPTDKTLSAGPQVTAGLDLANVAAFLADKKGPPRGGKQDEQKKEKEKDEVIHDEKSVLQGPLWKGFLTMVREYLRAGAQHEDKSAVNYPKRIGEPLLARTSFVGLYKLVEPEVRTYFEKHPKAWLPTVLEAAGMGMEWADKDVISRGIVDEKVWDEYVILLSDLPMTEHALGQALSRMEKLDSQIESLLPPPVQEDKKGFKLSLEGLGSLFKKKEEQKPTVSKELIQVQDEKLKVNEKADKLRKELLSMRDRYRELVTFTGLTIGVWLEGILAGEDKLTGVKDAESMGEFGEKTEKVGPNGVDGGIFEYRGAQAKKIALDDWPAFAAEYFLRVMRANGHDV